MDILEEIKESWGWAGVNPVQVVLENDFGNLILMDSDSKFWRLCPEDVYCEIIALNQAELEHLFTDQEFLLDWQMELMVNEAKEKLGNLDEGQKYHMVMPGVLGGEYGGSNIKKVPFVEIIRFSGDLGKQLKDLPSGSEVQFKVI